MNTLEALDLMGQLLDARRERDEARARAEEVEDILRRLLAHGVTVPVLGRAAKALGFPEIGPAEADAILALVGPNKSVEPNTGGEGPGR